MSIPFLSKSFGQFASFSLTLGALCVGAALAAPKTLTYKYDALGRLTFVTDAQNGNRDYDYDRAGNRLLVTIGSASDAANEPTLPPLIASPTGLVVTQVSYCTWRVTWNLVPNATSYSVMDTLGTLRTQAAPAMSIPWSTNCPNGNPNDNKPVYIKACNASGCSAYAFF